MQAVIRALLILVLVAAVAGTVVAWTIVRKGLSTRVEPSAVEETMARTMRSLATPSAVKSRPNPVEVTPEVIDEGLEHFADHCASCHANDGSGDTSIGRNLYPPAPDMRADRTQNLSDGELFSIIENGIRLTGMPAWGDGSDESAQGSWGLVHFIRRLPQLTPEQLARMEALNPRSPAEFREQEEIRRFLAGEDAPADADPTSGHSGSHH